MRPRIWAIARLELPLVILAGWAFAVANAAFVVFTSFAPTLLIERGRSEVQAGVLVSWASWATIGSITLSGYVLDRAGRATPWLVLATILTAATCLVLPLREPAWLWLVLWGVAVSPVVLGIMALPGEVLRAESRSTGFGLSSTMSYVGFALLPAVAGYLIDATGSTAAPLWFAGALFLSIAPTLLLFRWLQGRWTPGAETIEGAPGGSTSPAPST